MKVLLSVAAIVIAAVSLQAAVGQAPDQDPQRAAELQRREQLRIAVQAICPVSGGKLGSMGDPIKVTVGEETVYLCCKGCMKREIKPEHWSTLHVNIAKAQGICPVMKHDLPKTAKWTLVEGQVIYICCKPCSKKIQADPASYLRAVDKLYAVSLGKK